jgi:hypothetical protein
MTTLASQQRPAPQPGAIEFKTIGDVALLSRGSEIQILAGRPTKVALSPNGFAETVYIGTLNSGEIVLIPLALLAHGRSRPTRIS